MEPPPAIERRVHSEILLLFDVDGTLTVPAQVIENDMLATITRLRKDYVIGICGAADFDKIQRQLGGNVHDKVDFVFAESGVHAFREGKLIHQKSLAEHLGSERWRTFQDGLDTILESEKDARQKCLEVVRPGCTLRERGMFLEQRVCTINVTPIGRTPGLTKDERYAFERADKEDGLRARVLQAITAQFGPDSEFRLHANIGGQIGIDLGAVGWDKTFCLQFLDKAEFTTVHFFGDKCESGGGDHEIYNHPRCNGHSVENWQDTNKQLHQLFIETPAPRHISAAIYMVGGPSGAGKDTLLSAAQKQLVAAKDDTVVFVKRDITRDPEKCTELEIPKTCDEFDATRAAGGYALCWEAHGTKYGIPKPELDKHLRSRRRCVLNVSRTVIDECAAKYETDAVEVYFLNITASSEELARRLVARAREPSEEIGKRVARAKELEPKGPRVITITNEASIEEGTALVVGALTGKLKYSLWLSMASESVPHTRIMQLINQFATDCSVKPCCPYISLGPSFTTSQRSAIAKAAEVALAVSTRVPATIVDTSVCPSEPYKAVILKVERSDAIMAAHLCCKSTVCKTDEHPSVGEAYAPYCSLLYGSHDAVSLQRAKRQAAAAIVAPPNCQHWNMDCVVLMMTTGEAYWCWAEVATFDLHHHLCHLGKALAEPVQASKTQVPLAPPIAGFPLTPASHVAARLSALPPTELEHCVLLANRSDFSEMYALPVDIARPGSAERGLGLELLWIRACTVCLAIVGTSSIQLVCDCDDTIKQLMKKFEHHKGVLASLSSHYGSFTLTRAEASAVPAALRWLPPTPITKSSTTKQPERALYVGVDFGRSDVKVAIVDQCGAVCATEETRWWHGPDASARIGVAISPAERVYVDPAKLNNHEQHLQVFVEAVLAAMSRVVDGAGIPVCGLGVSAAGCVRGGKLCGCPPAFGAVDQPAAADVLGRLEEILAERLRAQGVPIADGVQLSLVNDGDAQALCGAGAHTGVSLFLSLGTGLAGGIITSDGFCSGVLELGKVILGVRCGEGKLPMHDLLQVEGAAQGLAGTQRSLFNVIARRGGPELTDKAEQRAAICKMHKEALTDERKDIFKELGGWLALFVKELNAYLPNPVEYVQAGGKVTDAATGQVMLDHAGELLKAGGVDRVEKAKDSVFGQAVAIARATCPSVK